MHSLLRMFLMLFLNALHTLTCGIPAVVLWVSYYCFFLVIIPFYRRGSWRTERWSNLPKVTQLVSGLNSHREAPGPCPWSPSYTNRSTIAPVEERGGRLEAPICAPSLSLFFCGAPHKHSYRLLVFVEFSPCFWALKSYDCTFLSGLCRHVHPNHLGGLWKYRFWGRSEVPRIWPSGWSPGIPC